MSMHNTGIGIPPGPPLAQALADQMIQTPSWAQHAREGVSFAGFHIVPNGRSARMAARRVLASLPNLWAQRTTAGRVPRLEGYVGRIHRRPLHDGRA